jgi:hypothetical protein
MSVDRRVVRPGCIGSPLSGSFYIGINKFLRLHLASHWTILWPSDDFPSSWWMMVDAPQHAVYFDWGVPRAEIYKFVVIDLKSYIPFDLYYFSSGNICISEE